jgi:hypothetical protein
MGSVGTGATLGARGALASGGAPFRAYHGSPHSFEKFDTAKIGTGEGAQAYGHGLYFAGNEDVAKNYRAMLATPTTSEQVARQYLDAYGGNQAEALRALQGHAQGGMGWSAEEMARIRAAVPLLKSGDLGAIKPAGHMYEVNVNTDPAKMLDWDRPLSQQSPEVKKAVARLIDSSKDASVIREMLTKQGDPSGEYLYRVLRQAQGSPSLASQQFAREGIPGIRYLDQGSRGEGKGTSNYVVFDPETIEILRKYGFAVPSPAVPGFSVAPPQQAPPPGFRVAKDMVY